MSRYRVRVTHNPMGVRGTFLKVSKKWGPFRWGIHRSCVNSTEAGDFAAADRRAREVIRLNKEGLRWEYRYKPPQTRTYVLESEAS